MIIRFYFYGFYEIIYFVSSVLRKVWDHNSGTKDTHCQGLKVKGRGDKHTLTLVMTENLLIPQRILYQIPGESMCMKRQSW